MDPAPGIMYPSEFVPSGSTLSPLLFLSTINIIPFAVPITSSLSQGRTTMRKGRGHG
jgi:hypothetical protein